MCEHVEGNDMFSADRLKHTTNGRYKVCWMWGEKKSEAGTFYWKYHLQFDTIEDAEQFHKEYVGSLTTDYWITNPAGAFSEIVDTHDQK